ncbi:MAG: fumarylacetoacetate hydrolase family protein, partial [Pseudomonadota bacterium]
MKIAAFHHAGRDLIGRVDEDAATVTVFDGLDGSDGIGPAIGLEISTKGHVLPLADVKLTAPLRGDGQRVFCVGKNYYDHVQETEAPEVRGTVEPPKLPVLFSKWPQAIIGPEDEIRYDPDVSVNIDYEVELAVIIGTGGRNISAADAMAHVWGYTILN